MTIQSNATHEGQVGLSFAPEELVVSALTRCRLCQTDGPVLTSEALDAGASWECARCGQLWDAQRLAVNAAYARYITNN